MQPFCKMIAILDRYKKTADRKLNPIVIEFNHLNREYKENDYLILTVSVKTKNSGYLYVDLIDNLLLERITIWIPNGYIAFGRSISPRTTAT